MTLAGRARTLMVLGTASDVGKSTLVTALCRAFADRGTDVAPFKAQNMARNAYVCADGAEIGVAQAVQAIAARKAPCFDHNPILLKPEPGLRSHVIVHGKPLGVRHFRQLWDERPRLHEAVRVSLERLRSAHELILIEGAGSPAEINLQAHDLPNIATARMSDGPIVLVGDIDRGGVFASLVGTLELLPPDLRARVRGLVINKLRGDASLLAEGIAFLQQRTGVPVLGVVPHAGDLELPDEDSVALDRYRKRPRARLDAIEVAVVDTPALANFEDALPLAHAPGVHLRLTAAPRELLEADLVLMLGSKATVHDLSFLRAQGIDRALAQRAARGEPIIAICGGAQLLSERIEDPTGIESRVATTEALGLLPIVTRFEAEKTTRRFDGTLCAAPLAGARVSGFELHFGRIEPSARFASSGAMPALRSSEARDEGCAHGAILASMVHRLFDHGSARDALVSHLFARKSLPPPPPLEPRADAYDRLAQHVRSHLDFDKLVEIALAP
jgi:adenosylcobyric acid synthase